MAGLETSGEGAVAGGRYRVVRTLGRGGMGTVHEAVELSSGRTLALKRLRAPRADAAERTTRLFQQEFHTLSHLGHPRVVEVYDYGRDDDGEFYTMELLDGGDLRALAPLPWRQLCALLCDVCSALSMLHSRRLVHRDLSPRNIRCTADGKAKLIDFGAMAPFGPSRHVVGTPPSTAPEALLGQALDARTDLFAVGAAAYYGLTRRHAYPATSLRALRSAWRTRPAPPSRYAPDVPRELDELLLGLLQLSPLARPSSAAEVIERLRAFAELTLDEQLPVSRAYLLTPTLVGRDALLTDARKLLLLTMRGSGGASLLSGVPGAGRSRMLDACVLEGKLLGALVVRLDPGDAGGGPWSGARALVARLHEGLPALGKLPSELAGLSEPRPAGGPPLARAPLLAALRTHVLAACRRQPLMLAVDDLPRLDEPTAALIALLADSALEHPLLVACTADAQAVAAGEGAVGLFAAAARRAELAPLAPADSEKLFRSVFGDVPNVALLADRLHAVAAGNPRALMQLAQHLLDRGVVAYQAGSWTLPANLDPGDLPASIGDALRLRFAGLDPGAQRLARALALSDQPSLSFEDCLSLSLDAQARRLFSDLDTLVAAEIVSGDGERYALTQPAWRSVVLSDLPEDQTSQLHRALSSMFERSERLHLAAQHALLGGEPDRALALVLAFHEQNRDALENDLEHMIDFVRSLPQGYVETLRTLVLRCRAEASMRQQFAEVLLLWVRFAALRAEIDGELLREVVDQLYLDCGLADHAALTDDVTPSERLGRALAAAQRRFESAPEATSGLAPAQAIRVLGTLALTAIAHAGRACDGAFLRAFPSLSPLVQLSPALAIIQLDLDSTRHLLACRTEQARAGYVELVDRLQAREAGFIPTQRINIQLSVRYALGVLDAVEGRSNALRCADAIAGHPVFAVSAERTRRVHALAQGDDERAQAHGRELERLRIQNCPPQLFEGTQLFREATCHAVAEDVAQLRQILPAIERMATELSSWQPIASYARAQYHLLRGDGRSALAELEPLCASLRAGEHMAFPMLVGTYVGALTACGQAVRAVAVGCSQLDAAEREGLGYQQVYLLWPLALAEAALGEFGPAIAHAELAIARHEAAGATGVGLGLSHEVRARVAIAMGEDDAFDRHASRCSAHYRVGHNPVLTAKYERLMHAARQAGVGATTEVASATALSDTLLQTVSEVLQRCDGPQERALRVLCWIAEEGNFPGGFLYTLQHDGPRLSARQGSREPPADLEQRVVEHVAQSTNGSVVTTVSTGFSTGVLNDELDDASGHVWVGNDGARFVPVTLSHASDDGSTMTAVAVMCLGSRQGRDLPEALLSCLSERLQKHRDVVPRPISG